jgi:hypothetical protein
MKNKKKSWTKRTNTGRQCWVEHLTSVAFEFNNCLAHSITRNIFNDVLVVIRVHVGAVLSGVAVWLGVSPPNCAFHRESFVWTVIKYPFPFAHGVRNGDPNEFLGAEIRRYFVLRSIRNRQQVASSPANLARFGVVLCFGVACGNTGLVTMKVAMNCKRWRSIDGDGTKKNTKELRTMQEMHKYLLRDSHVSISPNPPSRVRRQQGAQRVDALPSYRFDRW